MKDMNKVILLGRIGTEPSAKTIGDSMVCNFSVATGSRYKDKSGEWITDTQWHRCEVWGTQAKFLSDYGEKGSTVMIEGELKYKDSEIDGVKKTFTAIKVLELSIIGGKEKAPF